jgi:transposase
MGRKPRVDRTPEEKWQIMQEGIKSGNVSETCRRHGIAPNLFYRWKDEAEQGAKAALGGRSAAAAETEKDHRIRQLERNAGAEIAGDRNSKKRREGVSCGAVHSQAREMVRQGYTATLVAATLAISRSSLYYRKRPRGSRANRTYDEQIVMACGEKLAYGYRRVTWWLQRKKGLSVASVEIQVGDTIVALNGRLMKGRRTADTNGGATALQPLNLLIGLFSHFYKRTHRHAVRRLVWVPDPALSARLLECLGVQASGRSAGCPRDICSITQDVVCWEANV